MMAQAIRGSDAQACFARALVENAAASRCALVVDQARARPWASATFVGEQLSLQVRATPTAAARTWLEALPDAELAMHGYVALPPAIDSVEESAALTVAITCLVLLDE